MDAKTAGMVRWLCQIYNGRGYGLTDEGWEKFAAFCEANGLTNEPPMGRRLDGRDKWDVFQEKLIDQ